MIVKFLSLAMAIVTLDVCLQSRLSSSDPLFFFTSSNLTINSFMVVLAVLAVAVSFKSRFGSWLVYAGCTTLAVILCAFGAAGGFFSDVNNSLSNYLLPLNYLTMLASGIILGICSLSYSRPAYPYHFKLSLPQPANSIAKLAFLVPKIPHSPTQKLVRSLNVVNIPLKNRIISVSARLYNAPQSLSSHRSGPHRPKMA